MSQVRTRSLLAAARALASLAFVVVGALVAATGVRAASVTLAWDAVGGAPVAGYTVHWGTSPGSYGYQVDAGAATTQTVGGLAEGSTYYFAVTAYDTSGGRSGYSNEVGTTLPYAVPAAGFIASTTSGSAPLSVNFTSTSTGTITAYAWTFGDGTTSASQNPAKTYAAAGVYTVTLTVTGPGGSNTKTSVGYITVSASVDTTPPGAPASLSASASGSTGINLSWSIASDNVGVTGYRVERCQGAGCTNFAQVAAPTGTTYGDSALTASTDYRYRVRATDAAGNLGGYSPIAAATTAAPPDTTPPSAPASLSASANGSTGINLSWTAASDNVGVTGYRVERCHGAGCTNFAQIASPVGTSFGDSGLTASTDYRYRVRATDAAGNLGGYSPIAAATTAAPPDTTSPSAPASLSASPNGSTGINLSWTAASDNVGVTGYRIERCQGTGCTNFAQVATPTGTTFADGGLTAGTDYRYRVRAADAASNLGPYSPIASATTDAAPDTTAPTSPSALAAIVESASAVSLTWAASSDNVGVTEYRVERCQGASNCTNFAQIGTATGSSYRDQGLTPVTTYRYRVRAADAAGNVSGASNRVAVTTASEADATPPSAPASLTATANGGSGVALTWTAATDNVGVTGYRVERCQGSGCTTFAQIASPTATSLDDSGLAAGATYRYRVRAADAAGNLGPYSPTVSATTLAPAPVASFTGTPLSGAAPLAVSFTSASTGSITGYAWTFGDGTTSAEQNPSKTYTGAGAYTVSLTVTGPGGSHTSTQTNFVTVDAPAANLVSVGVLVDLESAAGTSSNSNGILEPGETVLVAPVWQLTSGGPVSVTASAQVSGQGSSAFRLNDNAAAYGAVNVGTTVDCNSATGNCYLLSVSDNVRRPTLKWGITFSETLSTGTTVTRTIPIGKSFLDVATSDMFYPQIEALVWNDVTYGYADGTYRSDQGVTRWQTAMFLARAASRGAGPPPASGTVGTRPYSCATGGTSLFADVPPTDAGCPQIHYLAGRGVNMSFECGDPAAACPANVTTRAAMAVLVAGTIAAGGDSGVPATGTFNDTGTVRSYNCAVMGGSRFSDVPSSASHCRHINYLWARGIVDGYGDGTFHPELSLTRGQMAKFVTNAFRLKVE